VIGTLSAARDGSTTSASSILPDGDGHASRYATIAQTMGLSQADACGYFMEELLSGVEVRLEGYVLRGRLTTIGITDSVKYDGSASFERFEYPSCLPGVHRRSSSTPPSA
jgi:hypothetical protein